MRMRPQSSRFALTRIVNERRILQCQYNWLTSHAFHGHTVMRVQYLLHCHTIIIKESIRPVDISPSTKGAWDTCARMLIEARKDFVSAKRKSFVAEISALRLL